jgi:hypothetical protein
MLAQTSTTDGAKWKASQIKIDALYKEDLELTNRDAEITSL